MKSLQGILGHDLKGIGEPEYYIGAYIKYDEDQKCSTVSTETYIKKFCDRIEKLTVNTLKNYGLPLDAGDHPEMDNKDLLPPNNIYVYQMLIGSLQWSITPGR